MATSLQVNASTQQAVGAFNALAAAISNTTNQFNAMNAAMNRGTGTATRYAGSVTAINSVFNNLMSIASGALNAIRTLGAGIQFVFSSVTKELDKLQGFNAIMSVSTKTAEDVSSSYDFLRRTADRLGVQFDSLTSNYAKLVAALPPGIKGLQTAEKVFMGVAMAARTLHASNQDTQLMFYAVTQMASKGVISMEELRRQLGEKLPGVIQIAAKALNTIPEELEKAIRKGIVSSEKFLPIFGDALIRTFADSSEKASLSVSASIARLTNVWVDFVKHILDSGAGQAIVGIFDALREKLSDPYLVERFAILIKDLSDRFTEFINNISSDDLRNGFDTATAAIELVVKVIGKLIEGITWIINNSAKAGAIMGALGGAAVGSLGGPIGAGIGLVGGAAAGAYVGSQLAPSASQLANRASSNASAEEARALKVREQELLKFTQLIPLLQQFKGLNTLNGLENLFKAENLNTKTLSDLNRILSDSEFKTDADRKRGVLDYAKFGVVVSPQTSKLSDVLGGNSKPKGPTSAEKALQSSELRALGLNPNVQKELANYEKLLKSGKLSQNQYNEAIQDLIAKQPYQIQQQKELREIQSAQNRATTEHISFIVKQIGAREELAAKMDDELRLSTLRGDALQLESLVAKDMNDLRKVGYEMAVREIEALREKYRIINDNKRIAEVEAKILSETFDKNRPQVDTIQALKNLKSNEAGFGQSQAEDYLVKQNPELFQGTQEAIDSQRRSFEDMYSFIAGLRNADLISEQTAVAMKARVNVQQNEARLQNTREFFGNLASLSSSGNARIAAIGRAAAVTQATIDGVLAVQKALAAPPGWPYNAAQVISVGVSAAANVAKIAGFEQGGYTGNTGTKEIAGVVHGREYVVNADATARNRAALEAMNAGATIGNNSPNVSVTVITPPGMTARTSERDTPDGKQIEVKIEEVVARNVRSGGRIADALEGQYGLNRAVGAVR